MRLLAFCRYPFNNGEGYTVIRLLHTFVHPLICVQINSKSSWMDLNQIFKVYRQYQVCKHPYVGHADTISLRTTMSSFLSP